MSGNRIKLVKETVQFIIQNLESKDRFGIIGYSTGSREVLALTAMDSAGKKKAKEMAKGLRAQGATALCQGLVDGVNMLRKRTFKNDIASVMILTDGEATQGPTSVSEINACVRNGRVPEEQSGHQVYGNMMNIFQPVQHFQVPHGTKNVQPFEYQRQQQLIQEVQKALSAQLQHLEQARSTLYQQAGQQQSETHRLQQTQIDLQWNAVGSQMTEKERELKELQGQWLQGQWWRVIDYLNRQNQPMPMNRQYQPDELAALMNMQQMQQSPQQGRWDQNGGWYDPFSMIQPQVQPQGQPQGQMQQVPRQQGQQQQYKDPFSSLSASSQTIANTMLVQPPQQQQMQQQQPVLQQIQGGPSGPPPPPSNDMIADEDDTKQQPKGVDEESNEESDELPCTINTFGFGSGHNADLLKALAENGRGMYSYIENTDQISDTFAECLGGLVSIIGQDLKVQIQALNDVEINRCLSKGYSVKVDVPKKKHTVSVKDLQSEESRDFIFELKVPQIESEKKEDPLVQLSVNYMNVIKGGAETLTNICTITRISGKQIGERNLELDLQYNRVMAADAMEQADKLAKGGKLEDARKVLSNAQDQIKKSKSNKDEYCVSLVNDIGRIQSQMVDRSAYRSRGAKMMSSNMQVQQMQRSTNSSAYASQARYETRGKKKMKKRFKGGY